MGAPRSRRPADRPAVRSAAADRPSRVVRIVTDQGGQPHRMLTDHPHRGRPPRRPPRRPRGAGGRPARAPVRGVHGDRRPRPGREGRPRPDRRRPVRLERPAAALGRARRRRAQAPGRGADPDGHHPGHPRRATTGRRSTAPTTSRRWPAAPAGDDLVTVLDARPSDGPPRRAATRSSYGPRLRHQARAAQPARRPRRRRPTPTAGADLADRAGPRLDRDPGQDRPRRGRHHDRGDRARPASTTSRSATGTRPRQAKAGAVTYAYAGRPGAGRPRPGPGRQGAARRARRTRRQADGHGRGARSGRTRFEKRRARRRRRSAASPRSSSASPTRADPGPRPRRAARRRPAGRARPRHRRGRDGARAVVPQGPRPRRLAAGPDRGRAAVARHDRRGVHPRPRGADRRARGRPASTAEAAELRDALRLGRLLLAGHEVTL